MIIDLNQLPWLRQKYQNSLIVLAEGTFDLVHLGHIHTFTNLHNYGDLVVIGIKSDSAVKKGKGPKRPIFSLQQRIEIVDAIKHVDVVFPLSVPVVHPGSAAIEAMKLLKPNKFITVDKSWQQYKQSVTDLGIELIISKRISEDSTTNLIQKIQSMKR